MGQTSSLDISNFSSSSTLVTNISEEYKKNPQQTERYIREVERLNQTGNSAFETIPASCFQISSGITASASPVAIELKRIVFLLRTGDNYASIVQYDECDPSKRGTKYTKKRARMPVAKFNEIFTHINSKIWELPQLTHEGADIYGMDVGLFVRIGDRTWANAPEGCHADADEDDLDEDIVMKPEHKTEFQSCLSKLQQYVTSLEELDWVQQGVVKGSNSPTGGLSALGGSRQFGSGGGKPEPEGFVLSSDTCTDGSAAAGGGGGGAAAPATAGSSGSGGVASPGTDEATKQKWKEKAGDVEIDENFVDEDWD